MSPCFCRNHRSVLEDQMINQIEIQIANQIENQIANQLEYEELEDNLERCQCDCRNALQIPVLRKTR